MESRAGICGVLNIEVPEDEILRRMEGRRVCSKCGQVFNIAFQKPQREGICDLCGGELYQRDDDKPDVVRERLNVYSQEVGMLIGYYAQKGCLRRIDGRGTPDQVYQRIETALLEISR
jgi:adenylate kinase